MEQKSFSSLVRQHFGFLLEEFGYSMTENLYSTEPFGGGIIQFQSSDVIISIMLDRDDLSVMIGPLKDPEIARLSVEIVVNYLTNGKVNSVISREWYPQPTASRIEKRLIRYAKTLRQYCESLLRGDLSWWLKPFKNYIKQLQDDYRLKTGKELPNKSIVDYIDYIKSKEEHDNQPGRLG